MRNFKIGDQLWINVADIDNSTCIDFDIQTCIYSLIECQLENYFKYTKEFIHIATWIKVELIYCIADSISEELSNYVRQTIKLLTSN